MMEKRESGETAEEPFVLRRIRIFLNSFVRSSSVRRSSLSSLLLVQTIWFTGAVVRIGPSSLFPLLSGKELLVGCRTLLIEFWEEERRPFFRDRVEYTKRSGLESLKGIVELRRS
jgi:hypothetical protein